MKNFKKGKLSAAAIAEWLIELRANAYVPESGFAVTVALRARAGGEEDYYFAGVNVENIDHRLSTHAEEACIAAMVTSLGKQAEIAEVWVMGATCCGKCRQQIAGFAGENVKIHYMALKGGGTSTTVGAFLPEAFTLREFSAEKKSAGSGMLSAAAIENRLFRKAPLTEQQIAAWLREIDSIDYFSKISQAVVLKLDNGAYAAGAKVEDAAFLSMNAVQSALASAVTNFGACAVQETWVYTKGRAGKEIPPDSFGVLTMSALQSLLQMAEHAAIPVNFFAGDGSVARMTLTEAAKTAPTSGKPFYKK
jgi:cytidine deaminase